MYRACRCAYSQPVRSQCNCNAASHLASDWAVVASISGQGADKETAELSCVCHTNGGMPVVYMRCNKSRQIIKFEYEIHNPKGLKAYTIYYLLVSVNSNRISIASRKLIYR